MKKQGFGFLGWLTIAFLIGAWNNNGKLKPTGTENWKLGVQLWTFKAFTMTEALQKVDSCGIKYVEAFWGQALGADTKDTFGVRMSQAGREKLKELLKSHHIEMVAMGVISPRTTSEWIEAFKLAKEFKLNYITAEPKKNNWDFVDSLAGVYRIKIAIHDHPRPTAYWHPDSVLSAIKGHSNMGACADVCHWARIGLDIVDCLKKLEGRIYGVHLKDIKVFDNAKAADTVVGKGVIRFDPLFAELSRQRFAGMLSIEHESNWYNSVPDIKETVKFYHDGTGKLK